MSALVRTAHRYRGTYNITDFRWFGLRDNNSQGPNFQSYFGLLRDDYSGQAGLPHLSQARRALRRVAIAQMRHGPLSGC